MRLLARSLSVVLLGFYAISGFGQHAVAPTQRYHRLICLVHLNGSGKNGEEIKPDYVPSDMTSRDGITRS